MSSKVIIKASRLSFPALFKPRENKNGGDPKYQATILISKADTATLQAISTAIQQEIAAASQPSGLWKGMNPPQPKVTLYDGDSVQPSGAAWGDECKGCMVLRTSSGSQPDVVDEFGNKALDATKFYAGCYCHFSVNFAPYDFAGQKGIGAYLNCVMFARDGEPLSAHASAKDDFAGLIGAQQPAMGGFAAPAAPGVPAAAPVAAPMGGFGYPVQ